MSLSKSLDAEDRDLMAFAKAQGIHETPQQLRDRQPVCPAASLMGLGTVWCGIEKFPISVRGADSNAFTFCSRCTDPNGGYISCPTWRAGR